MPQQRQLCLSRHFCAPVREVECQLNSALQHWHTFDSVKPTHGGGLDSARRTSSTSQIPSKYAWR